MVVVEEQEEEEKEVEEEEGRGGGRQFEVLWCEVEIRNRKQGKHKKNGEINEKTKHKRQR